MDPENNFPTRRYTEVASKLKPSMSGFRAIADEPRFDEMNKPNTRQVQAVSRTGTHARVGGRTGQHARVGGSTTIYGRVGGRTGQMPSVGVKTQLLPRVGGYTSHYGSVSAQHSPVRKAQERARRRQDIDPTVAVLVGVGVFMFALLVYGISKPTTYVQEAQKADISKDEQNRLARAINVERAKQAELLYRDEPVQQNQQPRVATPPPGSVIIRTVPVQTHEAAPRMMTAPAGGVAAGMTQPTERGQTRPMQQPDVIVIQEVAPAPVIPAKPPLPQGGIAAGMMKPEAEKRSNPALAARTENPNSLVATPAPAAVAAVSTAAVPGVKVQRSKKTAPHGGTMYEVGPGVAMLEFALDRQTGSLSLYILDTVKLSRIMVRQPFIELQVPAFQQTFTLRANSGSAQFAGQFELLRDHRDMVKVLIPSMTVNGTEVTDIGVEF